MKIKLFNFGSKLVKYLFYFLFLLTFYFAITSPNLILGDNKVTGAGTTMYTTVFIIITVIVIICLYTYDAIFKFGRWLFVEHSLATSMGLFLIAIIFQIVFVINVHPTIGFDAGAIHQALTNTTDPETVGYYSLNPNNIPILLVQHHLAVLFNNKSWLFFDFVTMFLVDISAVFNITSVWLIDYRKVPLATYVHSIWLMVFPMIIVPYTDTWVLPLVSLYILGYVFLRYGGAPWPFEALSGLIMGFAVASSYFMKPSAIAPFIAICMIEFLYLFKSKWTKQGVIWGLASIALVMVALGSTYAIENHQIQSQTYIKANTARSKPAINFIAMGLSGEGGYNAKDSLMMAKLPNRKAQVHYSKTKIKQRLGKMGPWGYIKFLFMKHRNNTADGTFAWIKEGHFIVGNTNPSKKGFSGKLRNFFYLYGTNLGDFRYVTQFWWVVLLAIIAFNWRDNRQIIQAMRLMMIGGFFYLLIFEGGRSRYLIQFLPALLIMAPLSLTNSWNWLRKEFAWVNN